jgi:predicted anti-sigma-YlaC factor YlaD
MKEVCESYQVLMSGSLDGELSAEEQQRLETHVQTCPGCRREYELLKRLVAGTALALIPEKPPPEVWDDFLDNVYNRLERKTGWAVLVVGLVALLIYGTVLYIVDPWMSTVTKILVAVPAFGLALLFISVLRQRLRAARTDRYSKEVHR